MGGCLAVAASFAVVASLVAAAVSAAFKLLVASLPSLVA
jgi:hypothetical protein